MTHLPLATQWLLLAIVALFAAALPCYYPLPQRSSGSYAREQSAFYTKVRTVAGWFREFFLEQGAAADARRAQPFPLIAQDGTRVPDLLFSGPDIPISTNAQSRFYGTDKAVAAAM